MKKIIESALILGLCCMLMTSISAATGSNTIKFTVAEKTQEEIKIEVKEALQERQKEILAQTQRQTEEKIQLENKGGYKVIISPVNDSGKIVKLKIEEKIIDNNIQRTIQYISNENKEEEINSSLRLFDYVGEGNISRLRAQLSDGTEEDIKILPEHAKDIAKKELKITWVTTSLEEINHKNIPKVVYHTSTQKQGKFLGIFKIGLESSIDIDAKTGAVLQKKKPWWAFLVSGIDD